MPARKQRLKWPVFACSAASRLFGHDFFGVRERPGIQSSATSQ